ncbi:hypothetical protein MICRO8M_80253 [Microbacterium sp. 8M]|nr:hypothetical protein MICRO8M_80253 [Microbacterium sp. 8M]
MRILCRSLTPRVHEGVEGSRVEGDGSTLRRRHLTPGAHPAPPPVTLLPSSAVFSPREPP